MRDFDEYEYAHGRSSRYLRFQDLMRNRVREILLVSNLYDSFTISEGGSFYESILSEYMGLGLTHMPGITRVSSGGEALKLAAAPNRFDLIITSLRLRDMHSLELTRKIKQIGVPTPVILLTYDNRELNQLIKSGGDKEFDDVFVWQGDFRIFLAIIKSEEDRMNVAHDTELVGVQTIILVEDDVKFYSSYLPLVYTAVLEHTAALITEGVNAAHKLMRMRARPKIILCHTYEEAWKFFETYRANVLGVISDVDFPHDGKPDPGAGFKLARRIKESFADIPVLLQSRNPASKTEAEQAGASFLQKDSGVLLHELKQFMIYHFGFGDFIFRLPDGTVVGRAHDLRSLEEQLHIIPDESLKYHGERNDFSIWLKARTEFLLADKLRPVKVDDYESITEVREALISSLREHMSTRQRGTIVDFDPDTFDENRSFARIGGGSLGGKARGLGFANSLINIREFENRFEGVQISVPPSVVLGTDVYDRFMDDNALWDFAIKCDVDEEIADRFLDAEFPARAAETLGSFLDVVHVPLSVRSSSLLEDSQFIPFAGVFHTHMIPNNHVDRNERLTDLLEAIKRVYASTFFQGAKSYIKSTPYRLEEEKMAVIIQELVGTRHGSRFYPDFSGVARSHNFYPISPMKAEDGIASIAAGLGRTVVEGGPSVRFCPRYPRHIVHFSTVDDILKYSQKEFFCLEMPDPEKDIVRKHEIDLSLGNLEDAEKDGILFMMGSTYSLENHAIYDGISRKGSRVITFAPILKNELFPLADIIDQLLAMGYEGMSGPVEIEFAVKLAAPEGEPKRFALLQMRPMVIQEEFERQSIIDAHPDDMVCKSHLFLGNGAITDIRDVVVIDMNKFDRSKSVNAAREIRALNAELIDDGVRYILIGVGRWGSADPWLGIPVRWDDISGARVIVEAGLKDIAIAPSQGTHFFQNITSSRIGYITVDSNSRKSFVDWEWLAAQKALREKNFARHLRFEKPLHIIMDGHRKKSVILKPGANEQG